MFNNNLVGKLYFALLFKSHFLINSLSLRVSAHVVKISRDQLQPPKAGRQEFS